MHQKHDTDINILNHIFNSAGFPTGVANMGGSSKFDGEGLLSKHGGSIGGA